MCETNISINCCSQATKCDSDWQTATPTTLASAGSGSRQATLWPFRVGVLSAGSVSNCALRRHRLGLPHTRTTLIFAVGEVDPQSSGREERQRDGQTTARQQTADGVWNFKRTHFLSAPPLCCGTSFGLSSSFCQPAAAAWTPGFRLGSRCRLLRPAAHMDTRCRPCPQRDPSCGRAIKRRGIGSHQKPLASLFTGLL